MRRGLISILLFVSVLTSGQVTRGYSYQVTPSSGTVYTDNFDSYSSQMLDLVTNWTNQSGAGDAKINDSGSGDMVINPAETGDYISTYYNAAGPFNDQYSQLYLQSVAIWNRIGPAVRMSSSSESYYGWIGNTSGGGDKSQLIRVNSGTVTVLAEGDAWVSDHTYKLAVVGDELRCYDNGSLDTSIDTDGKYTDSSASKLTSGYMGICGNENDANADADDWEGGEL